MLGQALLSAFKLMAGGRLILAGLDGLAGVVQGAVQPPLGRVGAGANPMRIQLHRVYSLADRIKYIKQQARKGKLDPNIYRLARGIVTKRCGDKWCTPEKDYDAEVIAVFNWVRANVRYTHDIEGVDTYQTPQRTVELHSADCDDSTSLLAALLGSLGYRVKGRVVQTTDADDWNHIFALVEVSSRYGPPKWSALDATMHHPAGWYPPDSIVARKADFDFD